MIPANSAPCSKNAPELGVRRRRLRQQPPLALLGLTLPRDVARDLGRPDDVARLVLDGRDGEGNQDAPAVGAHPLGLEMFDPLPGLQAGDDVVFLGDAVAGMISEMWRPTACSAV